MQMQGSRETVRKKAEESLWYFCRQILGYDFLYEPLHKRICDYAQASCPGPYTGAPGEKQWTMLLAARGHGKSTLFTAAHSMWSQLRAFPYPLSVGIAHALKPQAEKLLGDVRWHFEVNERLKWIAPELAWRDPAKESPIWRRHEVLLKRKEYNRVPSFVAFSLEASQVGMHFDILYLDDLVIDVTVKTPQEREKVRQFFGAVPPLLKGRGYKRVMVAGTRWDIDDQYGMMLEQGTGWLDNMHLLIIKARDETGAPAWPTAFTRQQLDSMEANDPFQFACLMMQDPLPKGMMAFDEKDVLRYDPHFDGEKFSLPDEILERKVAYYTAVDPNVMPTEGSDAGVVLTAAWDVHQDEAGNEISDLWVLDITRGHPSPSELIDWCRNHVVLYRPETLLFETVGAQHTFLHWLDQDSVKSGVRYPIEAVKRPPGTSKVARILGLGPLIRLGRLHVPRGNRFDPLLREIRSFSKHRKQNMDDCLDALADIATLGRPPDQDKPKIEPPHDPYLLRRLIDPGSILMDSVEGGGIREAMIW